MTGSFLGSVRQWNKDKIGWERRTWILIEWDGWVEWGGWCGLFYHQDANTSSTTFAGTELTDFQTNFLPAACSSQHRLGWSENFLLTLLSINVMKTWPASWSSLWQLTDIWLGQGDDTGLALRLDITRRRYEELVSPWLMVDGNSRSTWYPTRSCRTCSTPYPETWQGCGLDLAEKEVDCSQLYREEKLAKRF